MQEITLVVSNYAPGGGTVVTFCGRILALGRWNLQMSWCNCPMVPRGQSPGMAADKCWHYLALCQLQIDTLSKKFEILYSHDA